MVISGPVGLGSVDTILSRSPAKCAKHGLSDNFSFISLNSSFGFGPVPLPNFLQSSYLVWSVFKENLGIKFAMCCFVPQNDFNSLYDVDDFNCNIVFIFSLFAFTLCSFISRSGQMVSLRKNLAFLSLALYPSSCKCFSNLNNFSWCLSLPPFVTTRLVISSSHTVVSYFNVLSNFSWNIVGISDKPKNLFFWIYDIHSYRKTAVFAYFFGQFYLTIRMCEMYFRYL